MKKFISALVLAVAAIATTFAQEATVVESREVNGGLDFRNIYNMGAKTTYSKWSFQAHGGLNCLSSVRSDGSGYFSCINLNPAAGLQAEFTFTHYWGLGLDYTWTNNNQENYDNNIHQIALFASLNASNWLAPYRSWEKLNVYANFGIGAGITTWTDAYSMGRNREKFREWEDDSQLTRPILYPGLNIEYNIDDNFSIGVYGEGRVCTSKPKNAQNTHSLHPTTNGGRVQPVAGVTVRYKLDGSRHIRNTNVQKQVDYALDLKEQLTMINKQNRRIDSLNAAFGSQLSTLKADNDAMKKQVKEQQDSIESLRSRNAAQAKTIYEMTEDESKMVKASLADLRFETGKAIIKKESYPALDNIVKLIEERREWNVMLSGYTDNSGDPGKNLMLSRDRAAAVKAYFVNKGIEAGRIQSAGYGDKDPIADNNTPTGRARNRRVELELYHRE